MKLSSRPPSISITGYIASAWERKYDAIRSRPEDAPPPNAAPARSTSSPPEPPICVPPKAREMPSAMPDSNALPITAPCLLTTLPRTPVFPSGPTAAARRGISMTEPSRKIIESRSARMYARSLERSPKPAPRRKASRTSDLNRDGKIASCFTRTRTGIG